MSYKIENNNFEQQVNLKNFFLEAISKWYIFVLITAISVLIQFIHVNYFTNHTYDSTAKIYIMNKQSDSVSTSDISVSTYLAKDYEELIKDRVILEEVSNQLGGKYTANQIKTALSINNPQSTRILEITVRTGDPETSKEIADCICKVSQQKIVELMGIDQVNIISEGNISQTPSSPSVKNRLMIGFLIGVVISALIVIVMTYSNNKIKDEQDIVNCLELSVLATIPYSKKNYK